MSNHPCIGCGNSAAHTLVCPYVDPDLYTHCDGCGEREWCDTVDVVEFRCKNGKTGSVVLCHRCLRTIERACAEAGTPVYRLREARAHS